MEKFNILSDLYSELRIEKDDGTIIAEITESTCETADGYVVVLKPTDKKA